MTVNRWEQSGRAKPIQEITHQRKHFQNKTGNVCAQQGPNNKRINEAKQRKQNQTNTIPKSQEHDKMPQFKKRKFKQRETCTTTYLGEIRWGRICMRFYLFILFIYFRKIDKEKN